MPGMARQNPTMRFPSNAPKAWPPTLVATTNRRSGSSSISSKPQICCCRRTASSKSACAVSGRTSIIVMFRLLPERFHFFDGRTRELGVLLDMAEALAEFCICFAEGLLRVDLQKSGEVHENEQQVAELAFQFLWR